MLNLTPESQTCSLQNYEEMNVLLQPPVCGTSWPPRKPRRVFYVSPSFTFPPLSH